MGQSSTAVAGTRLGAPAPAVRAGLWFALWLVVLGGAVLVAAESLAAALRPILELGAGWWLAAPLAVEHVEFASIQSVPVYELKAVVVEPWTFFQRVMPVDSYLTATVPHAHSLFHVVLIGAMVLAWPTTFTRPHSIRKYFVLAVAAALATALAVLIDGPVMLAAQAHALVFEEFAPVRLDSSWLIRASRFLDHGGRVMLSAVCAAMAIASAQAVNRRITASLH